MRGMDIASGKVGGCGMFITVLALTACERAFVFVYETRLGFLTSHLVLLEYGVTVPKARSLIPSLQ